MKEDAVFYVGQKAFIEHNSKLLVLNSPGGLDFPGGKIQDGETDLAESLKREVREETSLEIEVGEAFTTWVHTFPAHHRLAGKKVFLVGYKCKLISGDVSLSEEHDKFRWVDKDTYLELKNDTAYFEALKGYFS